MTDRKPIAVYGICNFGGVEILAINYGIEDTVDWRYFGKEEGTSVIEYGFTEEDDEEVRAYFMIEDMPVYLDECMRI